MNTEHDKLLKESEVKIKRGKWDITGVEKSKSRQLVGRKQIKYGFHKSKLTNSILYKSFWR